MEFVRTDYSLIQMSKEDVLRLQIIGDVYIGDMRFHAIDDNLYDDDELVGKIFGNSIIWINI